MVTYYVASVAAVCITAVVTFFVAGRKYGKLETKVDMLIDLDKRFRSMETKFAGVAEDVAEIKGMFTLKLKGQDDNG